MTKLPSSLTTVTRFSKFLAVILFFAFIISGFLVGMKYQTMIDLTRYQQSNLVTAKPSPTPISVITPINPERRVCGGIAAIQCSAGYKCQLNGTYPDTSGKCVKQ